jgi:hypothetical protein
VIIFTIFLAVFKAVLLCGASTTARVEQDFDDRSQPIILLAPFVEGLNEPQC